LLNLLFSFIHNVVVVVLLPSGRRLPLHVVTNLSIFAVGI